MCTKNTVSTQPLRGNLTLENLRRLAFSGFYVYEKQDCAAHRVILSLGIDVLRRNYAEICLSVKVTVIMEN